ncbi:isopenicillin N synthase family oxygenase [Bacteroidia bacterium]|jgi:isopenicillin N synthase-like dioxygenase|nr:isopenicillin N synthase family oxygenase [Bacteroidota bacterium]MDA9110670.1 isopenicillin N synthase family oxygenase [Bacteroidia bacterium]MDB4173326.1 isopenicillin N synthase family oxygenase [Bacteroidia bacterium]
MNHNIRSLNLNDFKNGNPAAKQQFVQDLGDAYEKIGFVAIYNHELSDDLTENLYKYTKEFYALPLETKMNYHVEGIAGQRGFTSWGTEHSKDSKVGDLKEFYHFGQTIPAELQDTYDYHKNIMVDEVPRFNEYGLKAYAALQETGKYMLRAIALYLDLDETYFDNYIAYGNSILRPIHYGPIVDAPINAVRAGQHEDINLITLLMGASAAGLEVLDKQNNWIPITALPNQLVVNVGDMLQRLTNNKLRSTTHRVVNPPKEEWGTTRFSIPFFLHPVSEMRLDCLESCITEENPKAYDDISAGEFLTQRLIEIGLLEKK